ncbi:MAG: glycoside hydrolase family 127 protein [Opitutaceae bacterium]|jgi:DUF1680 family protein|nr:glycoside hydrolase family 127 protein [Opitutaceae bacterium]
MFRYTPIPFTRVRIRDAFWSERQRVNHERSLPKQYGMCKRTGRIDALRLQWTPDSGTPAPHIFWDSDTAKWLEAACYASRLRPDDTELRTRIDEVAALFIAAQQPDGYLNSHFTVTDRDQRWKNLRDNHELYCAGHIIEAAVAHHALTGTDAMLGMARRLADCIDRTFGTGLGQMRGYCGHEEIELALIRLYHATGEARYRDLAAYFIDERGREPDWFEVERKACNEAPKPGADVCYYQAHKPVREQTEAEGHAVRAMYLYTGMADVAAATGDEALLAACRRLWESVTRRKLYVTGGIGSSWAGEMFTGDFDLPNERAYCETCASVALVFWAHRMLLADGDAAYAEVMERALFNGALAGMSLDGEKFFYQNPLASHGGHHRSEWFRCACCPSNLSRLLGSLGGYIGTHGEDSLSINFYIGAELDFTLGNGVRGTLRQSGDMPWGGDVRLALSLADAGRAGQGSEWELRLRIPEWSGEFRVRINGSDTEFKTGNGYACLRRTWRDGDAVDVTLSLPVLPMESDPRVLSNAGQIALQRGPFVYCIEDADFSSAGGSVYDVALPADADASLRARFDGDLLGGITIIEGSALAGSGASREGREGREANRLYRPAAARPQARRVPFRAIPYFAWDNRGPGVMRVWIPRMATT